MGTTMVLSGFLVQKIGHKWSIAVGASIMWTGLGLSFLTVQHSVPLLFLTQGVLLGSGMGFAYVPPIAIAMQWFPSRKGLVTGLITGGLGLGAFLFTHLQTFYINPHNLRVNETTGYFEDEQLLGRVPSLLLLITACCAALQLIGWFMLTPAPLKVTRVQSGAVWDSWHKSPAFPDS
jgi:MFS family permease